MHGLHEYGLHKISGYLCRISGVLKLSSILARAVSKMPKDIRLDMLLEAVESLKLSHDVAFGAITQTIGDLEAAFHESVRFTETRLQSVEQKLDYITAYCRTSIKTEVNAVKGQLASELASTEAIK